MKISIWLWLSLCLALSACGSSQHGSPDFNDHRNHDQNIEVIAINDQLLACEPTKLNIFKGLDSSPTLFTNATRLNTLIQHTPRTVDIWLDWIEAQRGEIALLMNDTGTDQSLESQRDELIRVLSRRGRSHRKPPLRALLTRSDSKFKTSNAAWFVLRNTVLYHDVRLVHDLGSEKGKDVSRHINRCDKLIEQVHQQRHRLPVSRSLRKVYEDKVNAGVRLLRAPRTSISEACLKLFGLDPLRYAEEGSAHHRSTRWHVVIKRLLVDPSPSSSVGTSTTPQSYLTLPLPHFGGHVPTWRSKHSALGALWSKRDLWWGARGCWHEVRRSEIESPLDHFSGRWQHSLSYKGRRTKVKSSFDDTFVSTSQRWLLPRAEFSLMSRERAVLYEERQALKISLRGILETATPPHHVLQHRLSSTRIAALWTGESNEESSLPSAYLGMLLFPFLAYEALMQLSSDQELFDITYRHRSVAPLVFVPQNKRDHRLMGKDGKRLREYAKRRRAHLQKGDLFTLEETPVEAWRLLGTPSMFDEQKSILKERLSLFLRTQSQKDARMFIRPGESVMIQHGPWLGEQRIKSILPTMLLP